MWVGHQNALWVGLVQRWPPHPPSLPQLSHPPQELVEKDGAELRLDKDVFEDGLGQNPAEKLEVEEVVLGDHRSGRVGKQVLVSCRTEDKAGRHTTENHRTTGEKKIVIMAAAGGCKSKHEADARGGGQGGDGGKLQ